jgi:hypothetical protein
VGFGTCAAIGSIKAQEALALGVTIFAGEAEGRIDDFLLAAHPGNSTRARAAAHGDVVEALDRARSSTCVLETTSPSGCMHPFVQARMTRAACALAAPGGSPWTRKVKAGSQKSPAGSEGAPRAGTPTLPPGSVEAP